MKRSKKFKLKTLSIWFGAAVLVALASYFFWQYEYQVVEYEADFASKGKKGVWVHRAPPTAPENILASCNCKLNFMDAGVVAYEDDLSCTEDRKYLQPAIEEMRFQNPWIAEERKPFPEAAFGRECLVLVMKYAYSSAQLQKSSAFTSCVNVKEIREPDKRIKDPKTGKMIIKKGRILEIDYTQVRSSGAPERGRKAPCVTRDYANSVYNAFVDASDCFNMHQKDLLAKLMNESGMHINAYGAGDDTGIGQLTGEAIRAGFEPYFQSGSRTTVREYLLREAGKSNKKSCQRILDFPAAYEKIDSSTTNRCSLMMPPENPYRNMVYTAVFYRSLLNELAGIRYIGGKDFVDGPLGMQEVVPGTDFDPGGWIKRLNMKRNIKILLELGVRQEKTREIEQDLAKKKVNKKLWANIIKKELPKAMEEVTIPEPDMHALTRALVILGYNSGPAAAAKVFDAYLKKRVETKRGLKPSELDFLVTDFRNKKIPAMGNKTLNQVAFAAVQSDASAKAYMENLRRTAYTKSLPEFLLIHQDQGFPGYLTVVGEKHKALEKQMGNKSCVSETFIKL